MDEDTANRRSSRLERRLAVPVLIAALLSIPAVPLAIWGEGRAADAGATVNWLAGLVLWAEWILLIVLAENRLAWLRKHKWATLVALLSVPAVIFTVGPAQALRLVRVVGTLRLVRLTRIIEAGSVLRRRMGLTGGPRVALLTATSALAAVLATLLLANPASDSRRLAGAVLERLGLWPVLLGGALLLAAAALAAHRRLRPPRLRASRRSGDAETASGEADP